MYLFGPGVMWATPLTTADGTAVVNPTPVQLMTMQEFSLDASRDLKELYGQRQFPVDVASGKGKVTVKAKDANISARAMDSILFGQGLTAGANCIYYDMTGALIPATPFTITVTPPAGGTYAGDLGVMSDTGIPYVRVASAPVAGQYMVNETTRVYTFAAADTLKRVFISYRYTTAAATSAKQVVTNQLMGGSPKFRLDYYGKYDGRQCVITLFRCVAGKWAMGSKIDDYVIPDMEIQAMADAANNVFSWSVEG